MRRRPGLAEAYADSAGYVMVSESTAILTSTNHVAMGDRRAMGQQEPEADVI